MEIGIGLVYLEITYIVIWHYINNNGLVFVFTRHISLDFYMIVLLNTTLRSDKCVD